MGGQGELVAVCTRWRLLCKILMFYVGACGTSVLSLRNVISERVSVLLRG